MRDRRTALIVEEQYLIALDIQRVLETLGITQTVFAHSTAEALQLATRWSEFSLAIVDIDASSADTALLLDGLQDAGVHLVVTSADSALRHGVASAPGVTVVIKPMPDTVLASAIEQTLAK